MMAWPWWVIQDHRNLWRWLLLVSPCCRPYLVLGETLTSKIFHLDHCVCVIVILYRGVELAYQRVPGVIDTSVSTEKAQH